MRIMEKEMDIKMPEGAVAMTPLQLNAVRFAGRHTVPTPSVLESKTSD